MDYRSVDIYPNGLPEGFVSPGNDAFIAYDDTVHAKVQAFRNVMVDLDDFRSARVGDRESPPIFLCFKRVDQTAGLGIWTDHDVTCEDDIEKNGMQACSLLLSGISDEADEAVLDLFRKHAPAAERVIAEVVEVRRPAVINIYIVPEAVSDADVRIAASALGISFFSLLGAE